MKATPRAIDPDFVRSLADGLTESYEAYTERLAAGNRPSVEEPVAAAAMTAVSQRGTRNRSKEGQ
ncbi:hypothetical protein [Streptomyces lydicus]|uniref:hypothetical protein n=1 Tax=Streptomyces lydicus TaxID=47763 RepID=UPI003322C009